VRKRKKKRAKGAELEEARQSGVEKRTKRVRQNSNTKRTGDVEVKE
jgi:hypothetical protein